jgi:antitoxin CcdA
LGFRGDLFFEGMRIKCAYPFKGASMPRSNVVKATARKRPVNLTLSEGLVADLKNYTSNLSATAEELLTAYVVEQKLARSNRQQQADQTVAGWNALHAEVGSFADEHSTL